MKKSPREQDLSVSHQPLTISKHRAGIVGVSCTGIARLLLAEHVQDCAGISCTGMVGRVQLAESNAMSQPDRGGDSRKPTMPALTVRRWALIDPALPRPCNAGRDIHSRRHVRSRTYASTHMQYGNWRRLRIGFDTARPRTARGRRRRVTQPARNLFSKQGLRRCQALHADGFVSAKCLAPQPAA